MLLLALALALRVAFVVGERSVELVYDAYDYHRHGVSIASGGGYPETLLTAAGGPTAIRPPLYPYLLGGIYAVTGDSVTAARIAGALLGTAAVLLVYLLAIGLWDRRVALVAAALAAVAPPLIALNGAPLSEPLFWCLELAALLAVLAARTSEYRLRWAATAGLLCGLATLTRVVGAALIVCVAVGLWESRPRSPARSPTVRAVAVAVLVFAAVLTPWVVRNAMRFERAPLLTTQGAYNLAGTYGPASDRAGRARWVPPEHAPELRALFRSGDLDEAEATARAGRAGREHLRSHPEHALEAAAWNTARLFDLDGPPGEFRAIGYREMGLPRWADRPVRWAAWGLGALALLGVAALLMRPRGRRGPLFVWLAPVLMLLGTVWVLGSPRLRASLDPFLVVLAAFGLLMAYDAARGPRRSATRPARRLSA